MSGEHELPTASVVRSSQATPARRRGQLCTGVTPAGSTYRRQFGVRTSGATSKGKAAREVWRKPECKRCEATDRNRIVKAEGCEASWHMTAKPTGTQPTVNAALVHRQFAFLPGEICIACGAC